jgi:hypothetical protein
MAERDPEPESIETKAEEPGAEAEPEDASSPFDHPAFLPVLLWGLAAWFGYDGWFNENIEAVSFNRYGFAGLVVAATYFTFQSVREMRAAREDGSDS